MEISKGQKMFTLLDPKSARAGSIWQYMREFQECVDCSVREICHASLYPGMSFEVVEARGARNYCKLRDANVETVEIRKPKMRIAIEPRLAKEGAITEYALNICYRQDCPFIELCVPFNIRGGQRIKVNNLVKSFTCPISPERSFSVVEVEPV